MSVTFLFPDSLSLEPSAAQPVHALAKQTLARFRLVLSIEDTSAVPLEMPWERWLRQQFLLPASASVEAASAFADAMIPPCWRVTPVHLHLGRDHVVLTDPTQLRLDTSDAAALVESLRGVLEDGGLQMQIAQPDRWYLRQTDSRSDWLSRIDAHGWRAPNGRNIDAYSPSGPDSRHWRRLVTEVQMSWHDHPVNERRAANGLPGINSIWLDGFAQAAQATPFDQCQTDLIALQGLMISLQARTDSGAIEPDLIPDLGSANGKRLLVALDPQAAPASESEPRAISMWKKIAELLAEPRSGSTVILTGDRRLVEFEFSARDRFAFWRSKDPASWFEWANRDH